MASDSDYAPGLEGVTVAETRLSTIDGEAGELVIGGFPLEELAGNATFEEAVSLLWNDRLPDADELASVRDELVARRELAPETRSTLRAAAEAELPPMDALRMGIASATLERAGPETPREDARWAVAQAPSIVAAYWRFREGEEPVEPRDDLGHAANFLYLLTGEEPGDASVRGLETYLNAVVDHGLNASTFTARVIVSTESDVVSAVTGAVGALKGPLHGGAPGPVLDMLESIHASGDPEGWMRDRLDAGERLMGFGHRVYRVRDPRAAVLSKAADRFYRAAGDEAFLETVEAAERVGRELLTERYPDRQLDTNVEFYTAVLLSGIGIPRELFAPTFAVARVGGWTAHCLEQLADNRLIRPRSRYVGERDRAWTSIEER